MNDSAVREIAQSDPVPNLTSSWGQLAADARRKVDSLTTTLRELDKVTGTLVDHGMKVDVDLGPIGNAAAAARRDLEKDRGPTFNLPA